MTFKEQIMKLQTYKMYEDEDTVYVERDDVLKLLEQHPCEDCISREAVLRLVEQYPNIIGNRCSGLIADIKHLPSVTPSYNSVKTELEQTRWIPVSERLPEDSRNVLITLSHYDIVVPGWYSNKKKMWFRLYQGRWAEVIDAECDVIAWQYFPEPYKEEGEDEE